MRVLRSGLVVTVGLAGILATLAGPSNAAAPTAPAAAAAAAPWSQTDANGALSRSNLAESTLTTKTVGKIAFLRSLTAAPNPQVGGCNESPGIQTPVLSGGYVYAVVNGWVTKYRAATGQTVWRTNPDTSYSTEFVSLAVTHGKVIINYFDCPTNDPNGELAAYNATTGALIWHTAITPDGGGFNNFVVSGPYVVDSATQEGGGPITAVHRISDGSLVWSREDDCGVVATSIVVASRVITLSCDASDNPNLVADDLVTGKQDWSRSGSWQLQRGDTDASTGAHLFVTDPSGVVQDLNPATGQNRVSLDDATEVLAVGGDYAYAICGSSDDPHLCAYRLTTGAQAWSMEDFAPAPLAVAAGVVYLPDGTMLRGASGKAIGSLFSSTGTASSLVVGGGRVAVVTEPRVMDLYGLR